MNFRIRVTPRAITDVDDQKLVDVPHFVSYSKDPTRRDLDPMHHRIDTDDVIEFDQYNATRKFAEYCMDMNHAHIYAVTCDLEQLPEAIQFLLSDARTDDAIDLLAQHTDDALLLRGRYNAGEKQYNMGMIDHGDWSTIRNQIRATVVKVADEIAKK